MILTDGTEPIQEEPNLLGDLMGGKISMDMFEVAFAKRMKKWKEETGHITKFN